jgi:transcriptional regulator with PAS, ATPase and Fis domain
MLATFKPAMVRSVVRALPPAPFIATATAGPATQTAKAVPAASPSAFDIIVADDAQVNAAKHRAAQFAQTELPILLLAETGTGKELFARAIHRASPRAKGPFVALNCGALTPSLLESELFGHAPGAFTGATRAGSDGVVGAANGGTLFLDEIAEMPDALQAVLLRVLDEGVYHRVGETRPRQSNFRLVSATCRALPDMVMQGKFRRDLFFRIQGAYITIPTVRERSDRFTLVQHFMQPHAHAIADDAAAWITQHSWPGNVRELKSAVAHACAMTTDGVLRRAHFPESLISSAVTNVVAPAAVAPATRAPLSDAEIDAAVNAAAGNISDAARRLGVARSTVYRARAKRKP